MLGAAAIVIEVFATNVESKTDAARLCHLLHALYPESKINFDLHDKDRVLRIEGINILALDVVNLLRIKGFYCTPLE